MSKFGDLEEIEGSNDEEILSSSSTEGEEEEESDNFYTDDISDSDLEVESFEFEHGECKDNHISFHSQIFDIDFHPTENLILSGLLSGEFNCYGYDFKDEETRIVKPYLKYNNTTIHESSCRGIKFNLSGNNFFTVSKDTSYSVNDTLTGKNIFHQKNAHEFPINCLAVIDDHLFASGDDNGYVKIWDTRTNISNINYKEHDDFISSMLYNPSKKDLIAVGGDGHLSVMDTRKIRLIARSDQLEDELLSLSLIKDSTRLIVGTQSGNIEIFNYGHWGDFKDRFKGHPESIECMLSLDSDTAITGSSDGIIRVINVQPNNFLGVIGSHKFPIERLALTSDKYMLASCSHDYSIKFWDIKDLLQSDEEEGEGNEDDDDEDDNDDDDNNNSKRNLSSSDDSDNDDKKPLKGTEKNLSNKAKKAKQTLMDKNQSGHNFFNDL